ncbi:MAG: glycine/sarcosine/betaine reductase component B subunit [SAR202 cluster bacterium]|jgi:glycine reductase|nr:glycine/sarcosine/betaine reductase component B subunit [SAR202 cluster bacterium]MDP6665196.1 glycine/sarcosine/betaine reductase component B subunit [SAR202 cluster bacterium]MDP6800667.1 glycine/sarcosine/betaine reductase component B subunit [SAR202 cluster bacterium]|tara:strand:+ start:9076 stop:10371 length:1296 start_codon:yes stop_codon:yes gene_type:complete
MKLEMASFQVDDIVLGKRTRWSDATLEIDPRELADLVKQDPYVAWADVQVARPGDLTRIVRMRDIIQPKVKSQGEGATYPGISGRPVDTVGQGRTNRLTGMTIIPCADMPRLNADGSQIWGSTEGSGRREINFIDMSGPGAVTPFAGTVNLCIVMEPEGQPYADDWNRVIRSTLLKINDLLAGSTLGLDPPRVDTFDLDRHDDALPNVAFVPVLASGEHRFGPRTSLSTDVYGVGRLTQPWLLQPTEMLDGAVSGAYNENFTWPIMETLVPYMCSRHGIDFNFSGCIIVRSNWESQAEKQLMANRAAQLAVDTGVTGAIVTTNVRGQRFLETILTVQALERAGVNTILMTEEEDNENGTAPPLLVSAPEVTTVVSTGTGGVDATFPPVERVIGMREPESQWYDEMPPIHGRYGVSHTHDYYGFGKQGYLDY